MGDSSEFNQSQNDSGAIALTGKIMVVGIIFLFVVVIFVLFLHLYAKWFWYRREEEAAAAAVTTRRRRQRRLDFAPGYLESSSSSSAADAGPRRGLDPSVLQSLPVVTFNPKEFKDGLECAVCLSDLAAGEKTRLLPKCNHGFHLDCIDMWFQSHSTCPLCRNPVSTQPEGVPSGSPVTAILVPSRTENSAVGVYSTESPNFPTNVLFWGNQTRVSTLGDCLEQDRRVPILPQPPGSSSSSPSSSSSNRTEGSLVIDIPRQGDEDEETKSPMTTRLRSLKRLLSRDRRVNPFSPGVDLEQRGQS